MPLKCPIARAAHRKEYNKKNKELIAKQKKDSYQRCKEKRQATQKVYYEKNKERISIRTTAYTTKWRKDNPEAALKRGQEYRRKHKEAIAAARIIYTNSTHGKKVYNMKSWKFNGLTLQEGETMDDIYERYINTNKCDICRKVFENSKDRCMDHDHTTGFFRQILCRRCNVFDRWEAKQRKDAEIVIYRFIIGKYRIN